MTKTPTRIAMWSGPRNISTAMMRAFENRPDAAVWDEPFYAYYLRHTGIVHPMNAEVIAAGISDSWQRVVRACTEEPLPPNRHGEAPTVFYQKHMTHHMTPEIGLDWLGGVSNVFLIRRPEAVLASYHDRRADPEMSDIGFDRQAEIFDRVVELTGSTPPVIDSDDVLADPRRMLSELCASLGIAFDEAMLSWPSGGRDSDGAWAPHWYGSVEKSTGFAKQREPRPLPDHLRPLAEKCLPYYERLAAHRL